MPQKGYNLTAFLVIHLLVSQEKIPLALWTILIGIIGGASLRLRLDCCVVLHRLKGVVSDVGENEQRGC